MPLITIVRPFKFTEITEVHPRLYAPGDQDVSDRCAEVAIQEGWAVPLAVAGRPPPDYGAAPSSFSAPDNRSPKSKLTTAARKRA